MNERIKELAEQAWDTTAVSPDFGHPVSFAEKFAELIVKECIDIAKNWEDELENANLIEESNAVGIVSYRIARQFRS